MAPGVQQLQGRKTLVEVLSLAGGLRPDAGYRLKITRLKEWGPIPLATAVTDPTGQFSVAEVNLKGMMEARNPAENIIIMPNDVISVPRAELIYVVGEVKRAGGFVLGERAAHVGVAGHIVGGRAGTTAAAGRAKILRASASASDAKRMEIPVNLKNILAGKDQDVPLEPEDILFVPGSKAKAATIRALEMAVQVGTGIAIYRSY